MTKEAAPQASADLTKPYELEPGEGKEAAGGAGVKRRRHKGGPAALKAPSPLEPPLTMRLQDMLAESRVEGPHGVRRLLP